MNNLVPEFKNGVIAFVASMSVGNVNMRSIIEHHDISIGEILKEGLLFPLIGWLFLFVFTRTIGVVIKKYWDKRFKKKIDVWSEDKLKEDESD